MPNGKDSMICHACIALIGSNAHDYKNHAPFSYHVNMAKQFGLTFVPMDPIVMHDIYNSCRLYAQTTLLFIIHAECCILYSEHSTMLDFIHYLDGCGYAR